MIDTKKYIELINYGFINASELSRVCNNSIVANVSNLRDAYNVLSNKTLEELQITLIEIRDSLSECLININYVEKYIYLLTPAITRSYFGNAVYYYKRTKCKFSVRVRTMIQNRLEFMIEKINIAIG